MIKKQILVFSDAGGTGKSYHADVNAKNQRHRKHYLLQAGWNAFKAVQGFGRTHRSNESSVPDYILVTTNISGHKRFISSIARRLDQLGALTKGQRQTGGQGMFGAKDNLENAFAKDALQNFYKALVSGKLSSLPAYTEVLHKMGLSSLVDEHGNLTSDADRTTNITQFLNRILGLEVELQNSVFDAFSGIHDQILEYAEKSGELDVGLENYKADKVTLDERQDVYTDESSGATTEYIQLTARHKQEIRSFEYMGDKDIFDNDLVGYYYNERSKNVRSFYKAQDVTTESGRVEKSYRSYGQTGGFNRISEAELKKSFWKPISESEAKKLWDKAVESAPEYIEENLHMISGTMLPIWDRLPNDRAKVVRVLTDDGDILLGRLISETDIGSTLRRLGVNVSRDFKDSSKVIRQILEQGYTAHLSNGWRIGRRRIAGEYRLELMGNDLLSHNNELLDAGAYSETIAYIPRMFIPTGDSAKDVFDKITKFRNVIDITSSTGNSVEGGTVQSRASSGTQSRTAAAPSTLRRKQGKHWMAGNETGIPEADLGRLHSRIPRYPDKEGQV